MGRRPAFFIYLLIETVAGVATALAPNFPSWLVFRIGVGFTIPAIMGTPMIMGQKRPTNYLIGFGKKNCLVLSNSIGSLWCIVTLLE